MYTIVERRITNVERLPETMQRAEVEFFPTLRAADGFRGFYLVADEAQGTNVATLVWDSKAQADAFQATYDVWLQALDAFGHTLQSENRGETVMQIDPPQ